MRVLFLDDSPARTRWANREIGGIVGVVLVTCSTAAEAIGCLGLADWDFVFLDHDLSDEVYADPSGKNTGSEVVRWIVANRCRIGEVIAHTMNTPAGNVMVADLIDAGYQARYILITRLIDMDIPTVLGIATEAT